MSSRDLCLNNKVCPVEVYVQIIYVQQRFMFKGLCSNDKCPEEIYVQIIYVQQWQVNLLASVCVY